jgi:glycosyltransferase involved in cell wall biosynthesis
LKIALINDHPSGTGIYSYNWEIYRNLLEHGVQVKLYQFGGNGTAGALKSVIMPRIRRPNLSGYIIHISNPNLGFIPGTFMTVHDLYYLRYRSNSRAWSWYCKMSYKYIAKAKMVIANSHSTEEEVKRELGVNANVVYPSVGPEFKRFGKRADPWPGKKALIHVGHDMPNKNITVILKALKMLPDSYVLVRVGHDSDGLIRGVSDLALESRYRNLVVDSAEGLASLYRGSFALVFPSLYEGFGIPPIEAMASGLPVVCSDRGGLKESAGGNALIVNPEDPRSIADAVLSLEDRGLYKRLSDGGSVNAARFSHENQFKQLISAYSSVEL